MGGRLLVTGYGSGAVSALRGLVDAARGGDPLAPVDVVVPSAFAGMTVRRALAGHGGTVNVRSSSLPQLAERLAARAMALAGQTLLDPSARTAALAAAAAGTSGSLRDVATSPRTAGLVQQVVTELDDAGVTADDVATLRQQGQRGDRASELAGLFTAYRRHLGDVVAGAGVLRAAAAAVRDGAAPATHVVLFAPRRATTAERALLGALAEAGRLSAVLCLTGEPESDVDVEALARALRDAGLAASSPTGADAEPAPPALAAPELVVAPDAEEEVRLAVRRVVEHLAGGGQPHRVAVAYRAHAPYVRLLAEHLGAAGLPHHVPPTRRLADSTAGRTLTGLLELHRRDLPRRELVRWLGAAPVLDAQGAPVPARRWDRTSRAAGVSTGLSTWRSRLERYAADTRRREQHPEECEQAEALLAFVDEVATTAAHAAATTSWPDAARALEAALVRFLGRRRDVERWGRGLDPQHAGGVRAEQDAYDAVLVAVRSLADQAAGAPAPTPDGVADALARTLDSSLPSGTVLGRGVHVVPTRAVPGADLDLLVVVGAAEGVMPPRQREHVLLRDAERTALSPDLRTLADRRRDERHDHLAALTSARTVVVSHARADSRSQRGLHASPWFTDAAARAAAGGSTTMTHASFVSSLREAGTHLSVSELDVATALGSGPAALAAVDPRYARGVEAVTARRSGGFGPWVGDVGELPPTLRERADGALSATSLQTWATCPHRFWLERVLQVHHHDDPADRSTIDPLDRGTLLHEVLEEVMGAAVTGHRPPDAPWTPAEVEAARAVLDAKAADLERQGRTGRPLLWRWELTGLHRALVAVLAADSRLRAELGSRPVAVESTFGRDGDAALVLDLPRSGPVAFAGSIDRVDELDDGGLLVLDYKSGRSGGRFGYDAIPHVDDDASEADLVDRGRKLQLVLYALAARQKHGSPATQVQARYWFVETGIRRGALVAPGHERRLLDVVDVAVSGIRGGVYPAHPGAESTRPGGAGWESCGHCDLERLCSVERGTTWDRLKGDARVAEFTALAEEEL